MLLVSLLAARALPFVPTGPDIYLHLLWTQQVMRCLAGGVLPVWLPDLNAGFGSPGIRLYSPLGTLLAGALGLAAGDAGSGLRALALFGRVLLLLLMWRIRRGRGVVEWGLIMVAPFAVHDVLGRSAFSEVYAMPLVWWLLETSLANRVAPVRDGIIAAVLWLVHAPSAVMTGILMLVAVALSRRGEQLRRLALAALVAGGISAWYTLPLANEFSMIPNREATTGGFFRPDRHVLASATAPNLEMNIWLTWCAVALLVALLVGGWWRREPTRAALIVCCVVFASPLVAWFWRIHSPLQLLQFPWRWLLPAGILAATPAAAGLRKAAGAAAVAVMLAPLLFYHPEPVVHDPGLTAAMDWQELGARVHRAFGGNPWVVDAAQNRPGSWAWLGSNLSRFGGGTVHLNPAAPGDSVHVVRWGVLRREIEADVGAPTLVELRLLDYPLWAVAVDGRETALEAPEGVVGVRLPPGHHRVVARWVGNPLSRAGLALAVATVLTILATRRRGWSAGGVHAT
ncbi:MAG: hypothetical protein ACHQQS_12095 [Thermoanaerobaculales bacterium]